MNQFYLLSIDYLLPYNECTKIKTLIRTGTSPYYANSPLRTDSNSH